MNPYIYVSDCGYYWEQANQCLLLNTLIFSLQHQKLNGNMLLIITEIKSKFTADILLILKHYYEEVLLYRPETQMRYKITGISVICKKYNGNPIDKKLLDFSKKIFVIYHAKFTIKN